MILFPLQFPPEFQSSPSTGTKWSSRCRYIAIYFPGEGGPGEDVTKDGTKFLKLFFFKNMIAFMLLSSE